MSELTKEKIYKKELEKVGAEGNNNLERIRSLSGGTKKPIQLLETKLLEPVKNPTLIKIKDEIFILGGYNAQGLSSNNIYAFNIVTKEIRFVSSNFPKIIGAAVVQVDAIHYWFIGGNVDGVTSNKVYSWCYEPRALNNFFEEMTNFTLDSIESIVKAVRYGKDYYLFGNVSRNVYKLTQSRESGVYYPNNWTLSLETTMSDISSNVIGYGTYFGYINQANMDFLHIGGGNNSSVNCYVPYFYVKEDGLNHNMANPYSYSVQVSKDSQVRWIQKNDYYYCFVSKNINTPAYYAKRPYYNGAVGEGLTINLIQTDVKMPLDITLIDTEMGLFSFGGSNGNFSNAVDSIYLINIEALQ